MIRKSSEYNAERRKIGGGETEFELRHYFTKKELFGKARLCAEILIQPGDLIPMHVHENDFELFLVLEGTLVSIGKGGGETPFELGDYMVTGYGDAHSLRNDSEEPARILAFIVIEA